MIEKGIFKRYIPDNDKLIAYGFKFANGEYTYNKKILDNSLLVVVSIINSNVFGKIIDLDAECEYTNFRIDSNYGSFAGSVKKAFEEVLLDIRDNCFNMKLFVTPQANRIGLLIKNKFGDLPFYEWESTPDTGVFKHNVTKKWYAIIMNVKRCKLSSGEELVDVINLKIDSEKITNLLKVKGYYPAYHMNKKYWISIILDETVDDDVIMSLVCESYDFASKKK